MNRSQTKRSRKTSLIAFLVTAVGIVAIFAYQAYKYPDTVRGRAVAVNKLPILNTIPPFQLTNQDSEDFDLEDLSGKVWITNFIFTSCPGPCPELTRKMRALQVHYNNEEQVEFVSVTVDPETDDPATLKSYAEQFKANTDQWNFLTGEEDKIVGLARNAFNVPMEEDPNLHTTRFVVVDQANRVRAYIDTEGEGFMKRAVSTIDALLEAS